MGTGRDKTFGSTMAPTTIPCALAGKRLPGNDRTDARPFRVPQSPKGITGVYASPCRVVGAAFSSGTRNPTKIYDNRYAPRTDLLSPRTTGIPSPRCGPEGAAPASRPLRSPQSEGLGHGATPDPDPELSQQGIMGTRRRTERGWERLISQNHRTTAHTLRRAAFCD